MSDPGQPRVQNGPTTTSEPQAPSSTAPADGAPVDERAGEEQSRAGETELAAEVARLEDRYRRALADLDNYRKRTAREVERRVDEVRERLIREWLEAVDSVERALQQHPDGPLAEGLRAVLVQMEQILTRQGVQRIGVPGEPFDPERHEAIAVRETEEAPDRTVIDVVRSGYALGDRVLRPAHVVVARRPERAAP